MALDKNFIVEQSEIFDSGPYLTHCFVFDNTTTHPDVVTPII